MDCEGAAGCENGSCRKLDEDSGSGQAPPFSTSGIFDLIFEAGRGNTAAVQALLTRGADVNARKNDGLTALMMASQNGHYDVVGVLLAKGANVNARRNDGVTALMMASWLVRPAATAEARAKLGNVSTSFLSRNLISPARGVLRA
jgi:ankyrin repeat protein